MSDFKVVILSYKRVEGDLSTGSIAISGAGSKDPKVLQSFEKITFPVLMRIFAAQLIAFPAAGGVIQRTDRPGLIPITLRLDEVDLFRTDPAEAIRQRTIPPQRVVIGVDRSERDRKVEETLHLDTGHMSLAECFGDLVYARTRIKSESCEVECHVCGTWAPVLPVNDTRWSYRCSDCNTWFALDDLAHEAGFAGVSVKSLLETKKEVFFLPRRWNNHRNWVTRATLEKLFREYVKEKES